MSYHTGDGELSILMSFKTLYEISGAGTQCFEQVLQDLFHAHHDLFQLASYSNMLLGLVIVIPIIVTCIMIGILHLVRRLTKREPMPRRTQIKLLVFGVPLSFILLVGGLLWFYIYPRHLHLAQKLSDGHHSHVEGTISNTKLSHGGINNITRAEFTVDGKNLIVYSNGLGFDDPDDPAVCNGQFVRISYLDRGVHSPIILKFEVREPLVTECERETVDWHQPDGH